MTVKTLGTFLDRLKLSLRNDVCGLCQQAVKASPQPLICPACEKRIRLRAQAPVYPMPFGSLYAACGFPYRVKQLIYGLKFGGNAANGMRLAEILIHYWQPHPARLSKPWVVVPIPPHQSAASPHLDLIAGPFASHFGYRYRQDALFWQQPVLAQHTLHSKRKRRENVTGAMAVDPVFLKQLKPDTQIVVIDDLLTTGFTLAEALSAFNRAGTHVHVAGLAVSHVPLAFTRNTDDAYALH